MTADAATTTPALVSNTITTLAEIRTVLAEDVWPSRGLAVRAGIVAANPKVTGLLLRIGDGQQMRAARLWLRIANYLDDGGQLVAALSLAAQCAYRGGNHSAVRNCVSRAHRAARLHHVAVPQVVDELEEATAETAMAPQAGHAG
ncbi:MAG: hypothetical protein JO044_00160 [Mycobacteriaceae bacterium]|nr:hypothetical protein [Mycobacteriaceae bacterium]MBV9640829.1 hypothetical protein [Mycobacteriaceae bacterium]